jgi:hypothetical protein
MSSKRKEGTQSIISLLRELFYTTGKSLYDVYRKGTPGSTMDEPAFCAMIKTLTSNLVSETDAKLAFGQFATDGKLTFQQFEEGFKIMVPTIGSQTDETTVIKKVREWMFVRSYPAQIAFERLLRSSDRFEQKTLRRQELHKAMLSNSAQLTAPEMDFLFKLLSVGKHEFGLEQWLSKIYDDCINPLQLIRECVQSQDMNVDDILYQMKLKIWDDPLDFNKLEMCLRRLDPSFSDSQCKALFKKLKGEDSRVDV